MPVLAHSSLRSPSCETLHGPAGAGHSARWPAILGGVLGALVALQLVLAALALLAIRRRRAAAARAGPGKEPAAPWGFAGPRPAPRRAAGAGQAGGGGGGGGLCGEGCLCAGGLCGKGAADAEAGGGGGPAGAEPCTSCSTSHKVYLNAAVDKAVKCTRAAIQNNVELSLEHLRSG
jgi:hypothetical protein